ncbi:hypothetical protein AMTR_s00081p00123810 [Amborella trichopoda]|uniref:F-box domain-containing protein n=1 Tax=Amborella trichopoda TaxID=13333 RepID=W1P9Y8_AMBTC|nr:hypothetical protein AMTR_s00081p00123810 [Amborella trichopoda]
MKGRHKSKNSFQVCVAGGASSSGYERTVEVYKSWIGSWCHAGEVPDRLAGRLAVWAGGEGVWCGGVVYWMTSARPFRVVNWKGGCIWGEVEVPTGGLIGCSGLVEREGNVALVGGDGFGGVCVWELKGEGEWSEVGRVPRDMVGRLVKRGAGTHKCVAGEGVVYVYGESREGVVVWRKREKEWEWELGEGLELGCGGEKGFPIKGVVVQPGLMASCVDSF